MVCPAAHSGAAGTCFSLLTDKGKKFLPPPKKKKRNFYAPAIIFTGRADVRPIAGGGEKQAGSHGFRRTRAVAFLHYI